MGEDGVRAVVVIPRMVFAGVMRRRIVQLTAASGQAAGIPVTVARVLSPHPLLVGALVRRHVEAVRAGPVVSAGEVRTEPYLRPHLVPIAGHAHGPSPLLDLQARIAAILPPRYQAPDVAVSAAPMAAAPLQFGPDGQVAWDAMWQGFCELALAGGPPHRGTLLEASPREEVLANPERYAEVVRELARGVRLITGLDVVLDGPPGWIGVVCASEAMAAWLLRAIVVENILARREDRVLYLPAGPRFGLASEVRNVITALAKSHHYWIEHVAASVDR